MPEKMVCVMNELAAGATVDGFAVPNAFELTCVAGTVGVGGGDNCRLQK